MSHDFYRFKRTRVESLSALKGMNSSYAITGAQNELLYTCHVVGSCLGGTSTFHRSPEDEEVLFRLEPKRKVLNLTYFVCEGESGPRIATLEVFKTRGMKVCDADGRELYRVVDPKDRLGKLVQALLEEACGEYAIVSDDQIIGQFGRRDRAEEQATSRKGLLGRVLAGLSKALLRDWCVEVEDEDEGKAIADHRPLLAAMILLLEQSISNDQAT